MKVELSEKDIINTIGFLGRSTIVGEQALTMALLLQTYQAFLRPAPTDGAQPTEALEDAVDG